MGQHKDQVMDENENGNEDEDEDEDEDGVEAKAVEFSVAPPPFKITLWPSRRDHNWPRCQSF